jgi:hypothetical protein
MNTSAAVLAFVQMHKLEGVIAKRVNSSTSQVAAPAAGRRSG